MNEIVDFISKGHFAAAQAVKDNLDAAVQNLYRSIIEKAFPILDVEKLLASSDMTPLVLNSFSTPSGLLIRESICWYGDCLASGICLHSDDEGELKKTGQSLLKQYQNEPGNSASASNGIVYWPVWFQIGSSKDEGWRNACFLDGLSNPENQKELVQDMRATAQRCNRIFNEIKKEFSTTGAGAPKE